MISASDYKNLWSKTRDLYQWQGVAATVDFDHLKQHYYASRNSINPNGIVPLGPKLNLYRAPDRAVSTAMIQAAALAWRRTL